MRISKAQSSTIANQIFERLNKRSGFRQSVTEQYKSVTMHRLKYNLEQAIKNKPVDDKLVDLITTNLQSFGLCGTWWNNLSATERKSVIQDIRESIAARSFISEEDRDSKPAFFVVLKKGKDYRPRSDSKVKGSYQAALAEAKRLASRASDVTRQNQYVVFQAVAVVDPPEAKEPKVVKMK